MQQVAQTSSIKNTIFVLKLNEKYQQKNETTYLQH